MAWTYAVDKTKTRKKPMLFKDSSREKRCWRLSFSTYKYTHNWRTYAKASYRQVVEKYKSKMRKSICVAI